MIAIKYVNDFIVAGKADYVNKLGKYLTVTLNDR